MAEEKKSEGKEKEKEKDKAEAEAAPAPAKKGGKMLFIILGAVGLVILAGVPAVYFLVLKKSAVEEVASDAASVEGEGENSTHGVTNEELAEGEELLGPIFPLETFVVNLTGGGFLRTQVQLEFVERDIPNRFYARAVPVRDKIISLLTLKTKEDLLGAGGKNTLRGEIRDVVNEILGKEEVKAVYFTQFVIQ